MVLDQHVLSYDPAKDGSLDDFIERVVKLEKSMKPQSFDARPLPPNPKIMTIPPEASVHRDIGLWKDTCPVCRPLVKDLHLLNSASPDMLQDEDIYIQWQPSFSQLSSALDIGEQDQRADAPDTVNAEKYEHGYASEGSQEADNLDSTTKKLSRLGYKESNFEDSEKKTRAGERNGPVPCPFCAYFACLMFDDPMYMFFFGPGFDSLNSEMKCCCSKSLAKSERVAKVGKKFKSYVELYGPDAGIGFLIRPVDFDPVDRGFGKLRFQAHTLSPTIPDEDLMTILGMRRELVLEVYKVQGRMSQYSPNLKYFPVAANPASWHQTGKAWISDCIANHKDCHPPAKGKLPTRIVEILDDKTFRVVPGDSVAPEYYIALSYCWGGPQEFALTLDTLKNKTVGFNASDLPDTIKDAVSVTHRLGIKYIWIDSLCIIQDSAEDKRGELPRMAAYYSSSYVTICASTVNCKQSFLSVDGICKDHADSGFAKDLVPLSLLTRLTTTPSNQGDRPDDSNQVARLQDFVDEILVRRECPWFFSTEPISSRAWTFQERVLSPRILFFGGRLGYQCHTTQKTAGGVDYSHYDAPSIELKRLRRLFSKTQQATVSNQDSHSGIATALASGQYDLWYKAVEEFTQRDITVQTDKLPAISALAQVFQNAIGDEYLAGLWRGDLLRGLLWSTYPTLTLTKPSTWRAPTWSWASHDNSVSYKDLPPLNAIPVAKILASTSVPLSDLAPLGEVGSGLLKIEGPVIEMDKDWTKFRMQQENLQRGIEDKPESRYDLMGVGHYKNMTDPGCRDWEPPDGHILLILLATPVLVSSKAMREFREQFGEDVGEGPVQEREEGERADAKDDTTANEDDQDKSLDRPKGEAAQVSKASEDAEKVSGPDGYVVSGLVLGPVREQGDPGEPRYERLARFTTLGVVIEDYRQLDRRSRTVTIV